ncbi:MULTISPECIES: hypothetical protein [unclassified Mesorhizobium]|uniref:hypothetical protein n=1 Tax=unclassified Mesorhizobium TaxID=325217 RepID=UPI0003CF50D9|nr:MULTISPECIES: hypothetical protein [unclassified Mesorhizobium]ESY51717.1 hypothetical protein X745_22550 [Mesorhizobium sp. LNJC374B00]ESY58766.1 hypothetical protein X744_17060 [Mesorhizobium sp. LNJC372A00]WJI78978.1 hypothetical protein NLY34_19085 [Mesorhizobium sp. C374B]WJI85514.1 hypothetical protein NLY42_21485 [Mesorhizobium sp. C372A]
MSKIPSNEITTREQALQYATLPVTVFGRVFLDLSRNASYAAAARGDIKTLKMGRLRRVPVAQEAKRLGLLQGESA